MESNLQILYQEHHQLGNRKGFSIHEHDRGKLFASYIGTGKRVLDLGCRDGTLTQHYLSGNEVVGVDIDAKLLEKAAKLGVKTKHLDLYKPWNFKRLFDAVVAGEVLEHMYHPEHMVAKAAKILKPDGIMLVSVPNAYIISARARFLLGREIPAHYDPTHINLFSESKLKKMMSSYFKSVEVTGFAPPLYRRFHPLSNSWFADDLVAIARAPK